MPERWPVFFESDQAYRLKPGFNIQSEVVARYPEGGPILQSGWLLGEDLLRDQANVVAFRVGKGYVVTMGSQIDFRAAAARHVQAAVQRDVPRPVHLGPAARHGGRAHDRRAVEEASAGSGESSPVAGVSARRPADVIQGEDGPRRCYSPLARPCRPRCCLR